MSRIDDASDLLLDESTLADRYAIPSDEMIAIREKLRKAYHDFPRFKMTRDGFVIVQAYKIMVCEAV